MSAEESKHTTHHAREEVKHQEGVQYMPMGESTSKETFEQEEGHYDNDGFYILNNGGFYDPWGYHFDKDGYDEYGGYYDDDGYYVPGEQYMQEYYQNYNLGDYHDKYADEDLEGEEITYPYNEDDAIYMEHIAPALKSLKSGQKYVVKIENVYHIANESNVEKFLRKNVKDLKFSKILIERNSRGKSKGICWFASDDLNSINGVLKLHHAVIYFVSLLILLSIDLSRPKTKNILNGICI